MQAGVSLSSIPASSITLGRCTGLLDCYTPRLRLLTVDTGGSSGGFSTKAAAFTARLRLAVRVADRGTSMTERNTFCLVAAITIPPSPATTTPSATGCLFSFSAFVAVTVGGDNSRALHSVASSAGCFFGFRACLPAGSGGSISPAPLSAAKSPATGFSFGFRWAFLTAGACNSPFRWCARTTAEVRPPTVSQLMLPLLTPGTLAVFLSPLAQR
mmetsp:Transcript_46102/g.76194  ORF Transcript_46102/g.76194 Transcript_46102/m.76194 type:complete len:214 (+) Transcript_46102:106-747(+)